MLQQAAINVLLIVWSFGIIGVFTCGNSDATPPDWLASHFERKGRFDTDRSSGPAPPEKAP